MHNISKISVGTIINNNWFNKTRRRLTYCRNCWKFSQKTSQPGHWQILWWNNGWCWAVNKGKKMNFLQNIYIYPINYTLIINDVKYKAVADLGKGPTLSGSHLINLRSEVSEKFSGPHLILKQVWIGHCKGQTVQVWKVWKVSNMDTLF